MRRPARGRCGGIRDQAGGFRCGVSSIVITLGIVAFLFSESNPFFAAWAGEFLTGTEWGRRATPTIRSSAFCRSLGTLTTTGVALLVALPLGTIVALYLSEFSPHLCARCSSRAGTAECRADGGVRLLRPAIRVAILQCSIPDLPLHQHAQRRRGDGDHDHSLRQLAQRRRHAERADAPREGAYALGGTSVLTAFGLCFRRPSPASRQPTSGHLAGDRRNDDRRRRGRQCSREFTFNPLDAARRSPPSSRQASKGDSRKVGSVFWSDLCRRPTLFAMTLAVQSVRLLAPQAISPRISNDERSGRFIALSQAAGPAFQVVASLCTLVGVVALVGPADQTADRWAARPWARDFSTSQCLRSCSPRIGHPHRPGWYAWRHVRDFPDRRAAGHGDRRLSGRVCRRTG